MEVSIVLNLILNLIISIQGTKCLFRGSTAVQELKGGSGLVLFTITIQCETHSVLYIRATSTKDKMADPKQRR